MWVSLFEPPGRDRTVRRVSFLRNFFGLSRVAAVLRFRDVMVPIISDTQKAAKCNL